MPRALQYAVNEVVASQGPMVEQAFSGFLARIRFPTLMHVARHWDHARGQRLAPAWSNLDPAAIKLELSVVWSWRYIAAEKQFVGRLAGQTIVDLFGKTIRRVKMEDFYTGDTYRDVYERNLRVIDDPSFSRDHGRVLRHGDADWFGERIMMPLSEDGVTCDGVLGATSFDEMNLAIMQDAEYVAENVAYFPLRWGTPCAP
jgi:hypothetical protein